MAKTKKSAPAKKSTPAKKSAPAKRSAPTGPTTSERDELLEQYWQHPDPSTLRVWADALLERGDPRGEYIQMCLLEAPTAEQLAIRKDYEKTHHTKLAGPVRPFLREFALGDNGLVERARCEADLLIAGLPLIERLNPHLALSITSLDAKSAGLEGCSLERIYHVNFAWGVIGSQSGSNMKDATLIRIAPALRRVRHLSLQCAGYGDKCFTPAALRVVGETVECLEYLALSYHDSAAGPYGDQTRRRLAPIEEYANVIATAPGFRTVKTVFLRGLRELSFLYTRQPPYAHIETRERNDASAWKNHAAYGANYGLPATAEEIEPLKRQQWRP